MYGVVISKEVMEVGYIFVTCATYGCWCRETNEVSRVGLGRARRSITKYGWDEEYGMK